MILRGDGAEEKELAEELAEDDILIHIPKSEKGAGGDKACLFVNSIGPNCGLRPKTLHTHGLPPKVAGGLPLA